MLEKTVKSGERIDALVCPKTGKFVSVTELYKRMSNETIMDIVEFVFKHKKTGIIYIKEDTLIHYIKISNWKLGYKLTIANEKDMRRLGKWKHTPNTL